MGCDDIAKFISRGKEQYRSLLAEATVLLQNFDTCGAEGYENAIARRQEYIAELRNIDTCLVTYLKGMGREPDRDDRQALDEFRALQETATRKILELDSLVIALAGERLASLKGELTALARGKSALSGYEKSGRAYRRKLNDTA